MSTSNQKVRVGSRPLSPYGGVEPVFVDVPVKNGQHIPHDPLFKELPIKDFEAFTKRDPMIFRVVEYRGYVCFRRQPFCHWTVHQALDQSELPEVLQGSFTTDVALKSTIDALFPDKEVDA